MGIRKSKEDEFVVDGDRSTWLERCENALTKQGFKKVESMPELGRITADYKQKVGTVWGEIDISLMPEGEDRTRIKVRATSNVDNIYALFKSPNDKILERFRAGL